MANRLNQTLTTMVRAYQADLGRIDPPPEVIHAMTVHTAGMRPVVVTAGARSYVMVVPPDGVADPQRTWRRFVDHYVQEAEP